MIGISKAAGLSFADCVVILCCLARCPDRCEEPETGRELRLKHESLTC